MARVMLDSLVEVRQTLTPDFGGTCQMRDDQKWGQWHPEKQWKWSAPALLIHLESTQNTICL